MSSKYYTELDMKKYDTTPFKSINSNQTAIIVLHGLLASSQQMIYINQALAKSFTVVCPNLIGHGTIPKDLKNIKYIDWVNQIKSLYNDLSKKYSRIFIVGLSLGGLLSLYLAEEGLKLNGIIIINTAMKYNGLSSTIYLTPIFKKIIPYVKNPKIFIKDDNSINKFTYPKVISETCAETVFLTKIVKKNLYKIKIPILIFKSRLDTFLKNNDRQIFDFVSSKNKELFYLNNSYHDAVLDYDKEIIIDKIFAFIEKEIKNEN